MSIRIIYQLSVIILFTLMTPYNGFSQKCSYEVNEIDGLLEIPIKRTEPEMLCRINNQPIYIKAQCIGTNKYLKLKYYKDSEFSIQEDREISFVLPNDDEIILFPRHMPVDSTELDDYVDLSSMIIFKLSADQYEILKNAPVKIFKYHRVSGFIEKEIKDSKQTTLMQVLRCVE